MEWEQPSSFGALLREVRLARGLSQEMLAEQASVSAEAISALERGRRKIPQRETLELLLEAIQPDDELRARLKAAAVRPSVPSRRGITPREQRDAERNGNLPRPLTTFFGREAELKTLVLMVSKYRLITLTGAGGVGKTRAALELALGLRDRFADGVWFVELGPLHDAALVPKAIAAALGIAERSDTPLLEVIGTTLRDKHLLLVLDNCEHLIEALAQSAFTLLTRCQRVKIVAASREPLRVEGEAVYRLTALDVPSEISEITPEAALRYSAIALFVERSVARDASFRLTERNAAFAVEICRRLDGIPLALELAAAKTSVLSLGQIADRLSERFSLLTNGARTALPRHQTLRALIEWSYDLLSPSEQQLFCRLAVFAGSWNLAAAEAVVSGSPISPQEVMSLHLSLVDKSLVVVDPSNPDALRFRLLETTREYAAAKLREFGKLAEIMHLHTSYVLKFARHARSLLNDAADTLWLDMVEGELDNVRTALEWSLRDRNDVAAGAEITALIGFFWDLRSYDEGTRWLRVAGTSLVDLNSELAALVLAELVRIQPSSEETYELAKRSLQAYREMDDENGIASATEYLGRTLINLGRFADAVRTLDEGVAITRSECDDVRSLRMLTLLAFAHLYAGEMDAAKKRLSDARMLVAPHTRIRDHAMVLKVDAEIALASGDIARAVERALQTLELLEEIGDHRGIGIVRYLAAQALVAADRLPEAYAHASAAVRILMRAQIPVALVEAFIVLASVCERSADDERAARLIGFARARAATLPIHSSFLITGLTDRTVQALLARLGQDRFDRLSAESSTFDEARALAEVGKGITVELSKVSSNNLLHTIHDVRE